MSNRKLFWYNSDTTVNIAKNVYHQLLRVTCYVVFNISNDVPLQISTNAPVYRVKTVASVSMKMEEATPVSAKTVMVVLTVKKVSLERSFILNLLIIQVPKE